MDQPGAAVDADGQEIIDPSKNVLDLVNAGNRRQDDLRSAEKEHIREVLELRTNLGEQDSKCAAEIAELRAGHAKDLRLAEAARIDAIRDVDVKAVQQAAQVQATQAGTLAAQVVTSAEALRASVAEAASASTIALAAAMDPIIKDIADLRRAQYEAQGQQTQVVETRARGDSTWMWVGVGIAAAGVFLSFVVMAVAVVTLVVSL